MKTASYRPPAPQPSDDSLTCTQRFTVSSPAKVFDLTLFGALYAVIRLLRMKEPLKVHFYQGSLLMEHNGEKLLPSNDGFISALVEFEAVLLGERSDGYSAGQRDSAAVQNPPRSAA